MTRSRLPSTSDENQRDDPEHHDPDETTTLSRNGIRPRVHVGDTARFLRLGLYRTEEESAEQNGRGSRTGPKTGQITTASKISRK